LPTRLCTGHLLVPTRLPDDREGMTGCLGIRGWHNGPHPTSWEGRVSVESHHLGGVAGAVWALLLGIR